MYLAYFQSFTNTYTSIDKFKAICNEALSHNKVIGLVIATRPDCIDSVKLEYLQKLAESYHITIEYGIETFNDTTLSLINRGHSSDNVRSAFTLSANEMNLELVWIISIPVKTTT